MALLVAASLSRNELYIASPMPVGAPDLRQSMHASGKGHVHTPAGRPVHDERPPLTEFTGRRQLWSAAPDLGLLSWTYKPKPDKKNRRTLLLRASDFGVEHPTCTVTIVGLEQGRADLVNEALADYPLVVNWVLLGHTQPQLLASRGPSPLRLRPYSTEPSQLGLAPRHNPPPRQAGVTAATSREPGRDLIELHRSRRTQHQQGDEEQRGDAREGHRRQPVSTDCQRDGADNGQGKAERTCKEHGRSTEETGDSEQRRGIDAE